LGFSSGKNESFYRGDFTMKRVCSIFSQILQLIPRDRFEAAVEKHQAERHARGFSSWGQLVAMLFCQLAQAKSLREITEGLQASEGKLKHLGLPEAPARSTLAYANAHRLWQLFETVFHQLVADCQKRLGGGKGLSQTGLAGQTAESGCDGDRFVCGGVRLGSVPNHERGGKAAPAARS
jgi:hypothetical protein